jgi:hypothetical protein
MRDPSTTIYRITYGPTNGGAGWSAERTFTVEVTIAGDGSVDPAATDCTVLGGVATDEMPRTILRWTTTRSLTPRHAADPHLGPSLVEGTVGRIQRLPEGRLLRR